MRLVLSFSDASGAAVPGGNGSTERRRGLTGYSTRGCGALWAFSGQRAVVSRWATATAGAGRLMDRVDELLAAYAPWAAREQSWPLTLFERFMLGDDRPQYPLVFQADLCFEGGVDPAAMQQAFRFASGRHPLLRSTIRGEGRAAEWVTAARGWPELAIFDGTAAGEPSLQAIDLNRSPGLRGWMRKTAVGWDVKLLFHHACCDGQGARMFIQDLVLAYALLRDVSKSPTPFFPLDVTELDRRGRYPAPLGRARQLGWKLQNVVQFFRRCPVPTAHDSTVSDKEDADVGDGNRLGICSHTFSAEESAELQAPSRRAAASLNDVAVAILFSVLGSWQRSHGGDPKSWLRISVPCDLRGRDDERMPAANRFSYVFLNRRLGDCESWEALLEGVQSELQERLQTRFGVNFLSHLERLARRPRLMRWMLGRKTCFSTAVLTNLSDPSRRLRKRLPVDENRFFWLDDARCYDIRVRVPPLRPKTHWGICILEYAGRMTVTFQYDRSTLSADEAERLLGRYIESWRGWLKSTANRSQKSGTGLHVG
jgi:NRPS condensation-like uncharacterized protein